MVWMETIKAQLDADKIAAVQKQNGIRIVVLLPHQLTKEFIADVVQW